MTGQRTSNCNLLIIHQEKLEQFFHLLPCLKLNCASVFPATPFTVALTDTVPTPGAVATHRMARWQLSTISIFKFNMEYRGNHHFHMGTVDV